MKTSNMKQTTFPSIDDATWQQIALQSLKEIPFGDLQTHSLEGVTVQPLYTKEMFDTVFKNNAKAFGEQIQSGIQTPNWVIAQAVYARTGLEYIQQVKASIAAGNEAIMYDGTNPVKWDEDSLTTLATLLLAYPIYAYHVDDADDFLQVFHRVALENRHQVQGVVENATLPEGYKHIRSHVIDTIPFHMQGADSVLELALALSMVVQETEDQQNFSDFHKQLVVRFAVDTSFFMEIAKLRAFRVLWQTLNRAYEGEESRIPLIAETSLRTFTAFDAHTNLLRASNETLAAVLGGVDVMTVHPYTILDEVTPASVRNARNTQLIIREETFIKYVLDPASGSYYLDILTNELVNAAWRLFQEIEVAGGFNQYQASGALDALLAEKHTKRLHQLSTGAHTLVGTNRYVDVSEKLFLSHDEHMSGRLAAPFEQLRVQGIQQQLKTVLIRFGDLKEYKPKADFVKGFLAAGGIDVVESPVFQDVTAVAQWLTNQRDTYFILCTSYHHAISLLDAIPTLKKEWIDVAGTFLEDEKKNLHVHGVDDVIYHGMDQFNKLKAILERGANHAKT